MGKRTFVLAAFVLLAIAGVWLLQPPRDEILGTGVIESAEALGQKSPADQAGRMKLEFHSDKVTWHFRVGDGWKSWDGTLRFDPKSDPKQIDLSQPNNPNTVALGIYKIEGKRLMISMGAERPKTFDEPSWSKFVLQRE